MPPPPSASASRPSEPRLYAVVAPGLETVAASELRRIGFDDAKVVVGGVECAGSPLVANRWASIPTRFLQRVGRFRARDFRALQRGAAAIDWSPYGGLTPEVSARKSRLYHSGAIAERLAAIAPPGPGRLFARLERDVCTLSVDTTGERLHKRGWRLETGVAPLRETLAAGLLQLAEWQPGEPICDPMCGSGTFAIEAAIAASGRAPGRHRSFACEAWTAPDDRPDAPAVPTTIVARDRGRVAIDAARRNADRAGCGDVIRFETIGVARGEGPSPSGLLVCNPPYDRRAHGAGAAINALASALSGPFAGWRAAVLCRDRETVGRLQRPVSTIHRVQNGGIPLWWAVFDSARRSGPI